MSEELPLVVDGSRRPSSAMAEHLHTCLRCQAELAGYGRLLRVLRALRDEPVSFPPPDLVGDAVRALQERIGVFQENVSARSRRASETWLLAGAVAGLGVVALGARAFMTRGARHSRAAAMGAVAATSFGG
jgi:hypothetical protein